MMFLLVTSFFLFTMSSIQEKDSDEIVFKAMGRAINKTVTIVELIKVFSDFSIVFLMQISLIFTSFYVGFAEKNRWSAPDHIDWIYWYY